MLFVRINETKALEKAQVQRRQISDLLPSVPVMLVATYADTNFRESNQQRARSTEVKIAGFQSQQVTNIFDAASCTETFIKAFYMAAFSKFEN